ncbi:hypothetical protein SISSUDRAFT_1063924 [Sistotremastrum suecicum HHB10207 ss-3]|uniref:GATA-type domain-containing protein n=1 Tax=Sistotremastrum suecicum HHB10207 ss-3 TaxID=1314776 RepID=A0A166B9J1_9AGAM|nr:hypothetical protein SISSUDRAFT_1063924 [Sistotremastrum suecicum HHB10207 ss-3]
MGPGLVLKFKGNKSFVAFSNLGDADSLTKTWKVCTKVASHLEQGQRLENLSWRLWHLQNLMVESDNAKSKREFKKLSKHMSEKLDKEKGRSIEELPAPRFQRTQSTDKVRRLAAEKERNREALNGGVAGRHGLNRMQFTFSVDAPKSDSMTTTVSSASAGQARANKDKGTFKEPAARKSSKVKAANEEQDVSMATTETSDAQPATDSTDPMAPQALHFPSLFNDDFGPTALLYPTPSYGRSLSYGEGVSMGDGGSNLGFGITRPTIELPLDELLTGSASPEGSWSSGNENPNFPAATTYNKSDNAKQSSFAISDEEKPLAGEIDRSRTPKQAQHQPPATFHPSLSVATKNLTASASRGASRRSANSSRSGNHASMDAGSASTSLLLHQRTSSTPEIGSRVNTGNSSGKSECVNCGATHTPLWRRGLNDELNCNACGLYCKLHKRPRPKTMRHSHGEGGRTNSAQRSEPPEVMGEPAQCYNCHTMATPLWRKDDEGKTVCNACGLYYKLHGSSRPISMKSDVIRKRSRQDARRPNGMAETPSASPGASRRTSPARGMSPSLQGPGPDMFDPAQAPFTFPADEFEFPTQTSPQGEHAELMGMQYGYPSPSSHMNGYSYGNQYSFGSSFPGPLHPDYLAEYMPSGSVGANDAAAAAASATATHDQTGEAAGEISEGDAGEEDGDYTSGRGAKRRRLSAESYESSISATEPPSSAASSMFPLDNSSSASFSSLGMSTYSNYKFPGHASGTGSGSGSGRDSAESNDNGSKAKIGGIDFPMDFLHPPMLLPAERAIMSSLLHPPLLNDTPSPTLHPPMLPSFFEYARSGESRNANGSRDMDVQMQSGDSYGMHF